MQKIPARKIIGATKPFFVIRAIVYLLVTLIMLVVGILGALLCIWAAGRSGTLAFILFVVIFGGLIGFLRFAKRYVLYMVKAAHIAAITEYIKTGAAPVTEKGYKGVVAFGTERIKNNFGTANIAFAADALIAGATRQIMKWVNRAENLLSFIPGVKTIFSFLNFVLSTALNYIDEAVLSYVFWHEEEKSGMKKACDGLVYYAQSWKGMLKGALKVGVFVWLLRIVAYLVFYAIFSAIGGALFTTGGYLFALLLAFVFLYGVETIIVDPYATCIMVNDYHKSIYGMPLKRDLYGTLCKVSGKFRKLFEKTGEPEPNYAYAGGPPPSYAANAAPNNQNAAPNYQNAAPNYQNAAPNYQNPTPSYQNPAPNYQNPAPNYQNAAPNYQNPAPNYQNAAPNYQNAAPNYTNGQNNVANGQNSATNGGGFCSNCGAQLNPNSKFCTGCGKAK